MTNESNPQSPANEVIPAETSGITDTSTDNESNNKVVKRTTRPVYADMVKNAIIKLNEKKGSSRLAILKFIQANYNLEDRNTDSVNSYVKQALKKGVDTGVLKQTSGVGANGSFTIAKNGEKKVKPTKKNDKSENEVETPKESVDVKKPRNSKKTSNTKKSKVTKEVTTNEEISNTIETPKPSEDKLEKVTKKNVEKKSKNVSKSGVIDKVIKKSTDSKKKTSNKKMVEKKK